MPAEMTSYLELIEKLPPGGVVTLPNVAWDEYEHLLEEIEDRRRYRISYDHGRMEVMTLSFEHESIKALFPHLILILVEETNGSLIGGGATTLRQELAAEGLEPDDCFYLTHAAEIRGKKRLDPASDPPPDLAIEVDVTSSSLDRMTIYASLKVPEIWRYKKGIVRFYQLTGDDYVEVVSSLAFPFLTAATLSDYLRLGKTEDIIAMTRAFRAWVQANKS